MSISSIQKRRKKEEFTMDLLRKGIEPNNFELNRMLTEHFDNHTLGMPYYAPIKQRPYEESSKADYNHNFSTLEEDLEVIYEANIETNNKAVAMQEYYDLERNKVRNALERLQLRVENITEAMKSASLVKQHVEAFDDVYGVEFYGDAKRNIPYTTSFIDLLQKKVYTDKTNAQMNKLSMKAATISIDGLKKFDAYETSGDLEKVLTDTISDLFIISAKSTNESEKVLTINVDLGSLVEFNTVTFSFTSTREMLCSLSISEDGENYISVYDASNRDYIEWNFNSKVARYLKIVCHKTEPDGVKITDSTNAYYEYYYLLKNISVAMEEFEAKSVFVSKLIDFDDLTSVIKLDATDMIFNNTRIDYFIGFDNEVDKIGWDAIENHREHKLFMFEKRHRILNVSADESFGSIGMELDLYKLFELPKNVNRNSLKITPAYNMWSVKRYNRKDGDSNDGFSLHSCDFSEFAATCNVTQLFMDCENYDGFNIDPNVLYIFTQYISLEQSYNLFNKIFEVRATNCASDSVFEETEIRIFLNGYEITADDSNTYSFALKKGVNKVQIALYSPSSTAATRRLYHNLNFKEATNNVFGFTPMRYTSNSILERMANDTYGYYTIRNNYVYVKCHPSDMIKSEINDMGYFASYYTLREDMVDYFEDNHIKFRIMAVLSSTNPNVSPEIINFRITGK